MAMPRMKAKTPIWGQSAEGVWWVNKAAKPRLRGLMAPLITCGRVTVVIWNPPQEMG